MKGQKVERFAKLRNEKQSFENLGTRKWTFVKVNLGMKMIFYPKEKKKKIKLRFLTKWLENT